MSAEVPPRLPGRARTALLFTGTFVLGIAGGLGLAPLVRPPPRLPPGLESLHLSPGQRARIDAIVARHGPELDAALGDALPRIQAVRERVAEEIEAELDERQKEEFRRQRRRGLGR